MASILEAAGLVPAARGQGYQTLSLEALALRPAQAVVLGFYDQFMLANNYWGPGRQVQNVVKGRTLASLASSTIGCPDWFTADAVVTLAQAASR